MNARCRAAYVAAMTHHASSARVTFVEMAVEQQAEHGTRLDKADVHHW